MFFAAPIREFDLPLPLGVTCPVFPLRTSWQCGQDMPGS
jgi:hypothetical protein